MTFPGIFEYLTHPSSHQPPDNPSSSCFDENQTPVWAYRYKDLGDDVGRDPFVRAGRGSKCRRAGIFCTPAKFSLTLGWTWRLAGVTSDSRMSSYP
jgi:hypothetical protein